MKKLLIGAASAAIFLTACNNKAETTVKTVDSTAIILARNKQAALNSDIAFIKGDIETAFKDYSADFVEYGSGAHPPMKNIDSMKADFKQFFAAFPDFKGEKLNAFTNGDTVIVTGVWSGTFKGEYMKTKPTGKTFKAADADIFTFNKAGKITSHSNIQSEISILYQLGVPLPTKK